MIAFLTNMVSDRLGCEINLQEKVRAVKYLHNTNYFSVSQKNQVYIYDCKLLRSQTIQPRNTPFTVFCRTPSILGLKYLANLVHSTWC